MKKQHPDDRHRHPDERKLPSADLRDETLRETGADDDPGGEGKEGEAGLQRRVAEHALQVERVEEEHREEARRDEEHRHVRGAHGAARGRCSVARSGSTERRSMSTNAASNASAIPPTISVWADIQPFSCASTIAYTRTMRPAVTVTAPARSKALCARSSFDSGTYFRAATNTAIPTGMLTKKIHGHERASTRIPPTTRPTAPPPTAIAAHTLIAFARSGALGERRRDDRERRGSDERGAETLQTAADDEDLRARREPVQERGDREDHDADEEDPLAADEVAGAPAEQQEAAEDERVRVDDPLQVGVRHVEVVLDRRQRDVHDRRVQDDHELRHADEDEHEPRIHVPLSSR